MKKNQILLFDTYNVIKSIAYTFVEAADSIRAVDSKVFFL